MTNYAVRMAVAAMYDAPAWKERVSRMPDNQVYAIYRSNQRRSQKSGLPETNNTPNPNTLSSYRQLTLWDIE